MHAAIVALSLAVCGFFADPVDPAVLTTELGSPRFAQREAAELALGQLGRSAIPALRDALTSRDPEIRTRATAILRRIESAMLREPTLLQYDFAEVPIVEAIRTINEQGGLKLGLNPSVPAVWANRRVSLRSGGPVPFWTAVDALCAAGQLHYVFGGQSDFEQGDSTFALYDDFAPSHGIFEDRGPFRIQLASLQYQSEVHLSTDAQLGDKPGRVGLEGQESATLHPLTSRQFFLQMLVGAEPRLSLAPGGPVKILEAVDDQGRSLLLPPRPQMIEHTSGYLGINPSSLVHLRLDLAYPPTPATRLKKIKGMIPLMVSTRKSNPMEVALANASSKSFSSGKVDITLGEIRLGGPDQVSTIELAIKVKDRDPLNDDPDAIDTDGLRTVASPQQLEVLDEAGRMIPWFPSSSFYNGEETKLTLALLDRGMAPQVPTRIRYHELIRDRTEVPFEFRDLPMP